MAMFESSVEMWNFQMGNKLWDAQPMTSKESHGITKFIKGILQEDARSGSEDAVHVLFLFSLSDFGSAVADQDGNSRAIVAWRCAAAFCLESNNSHMFSHVLTMFGLEFLSRK